MCGRFGQIITEESLADHYGLDRAWSPPRNYNLAPTQPAAFIRRSPETGLLEQALLRWGLVPSWAKDPAVGNRLINARSETVVEKPAFRTAFKRRRGLTPASGYYEWTGKKSSKKPYWIKPARDDFFSLAGLWETWEGDAGAMETFTILTCQANEATAWLHRRMPVILAPSDYGLWLDHEADPQKVLSLLVPCPPGGMTIHAVSHHVNNTRNNGPQCLAPAETDLLDLAGPLER